MGGEPSVFDDRLVVLMVRLVVRMTSLSGWAGTVGSWLTWSTTATVCSATRRMQCALQDMTSHYFLARNSSPGGWRGAR